MITHSSHCPGIAEQRKRHHPVHAPAVISIAVVIVQRPVGHPGVRDKRGVASDYPGIIRTTAKFVSVPNSTVQDAFPLILETQTAAFRYELGDGHTYDFAEGMFNEPLDEELKSIFPTEAGGFSYFDLNPAATPSLQAVDDLEGFIEAEGPFDGVIAFSQGIIVASTLILRCIQEQKPRPFKCAIFFSPRLGAMDYEEFQQSGKVREIDFEQHQGIITVPTALIWGRHDPDRAKAAELQKLVPQERLFCYVHSGGHAVPGAGAHYDLMKSVNVARRAIELAAEGDH
ncbi:uncharacterized protein DSM5745_01503 [Aspergillus mulundensis]|uniref:Serine hydrolase domain-containing protein n=1 Tax=Aspergillus mulundensis TaxID=1810919 RepID=A0A3D8T6W4_9EURO|nr:Uncharacterized protein DSM5745_01503 [Aspergillus mulundensis]RDW94181.1 Uncharacterized protein DSM5745_01503 [Aspergillus mulundensis]